MRARRVRGVLLTLALMAGLVTVSASPAAVKAVNGGGWSPLGGGIDGGTVFQIAALPGGTLYAGGTFSSARTSAGETVAATERLAQWDPTTSAWASMSAIAPNGGVYALAYEPTEQRLWVGGAFSQVNGQSRARLARFGLSDSESGLDATVGVAPLQVNSIGIEGVEEIVVLGPDNVMIGGLVTLSATTAADGLMRFDGANLVPLGSGLTSTSNPAGSNHGRIVNGMARAGDGVIIGGQFTAVSGSAIASRRVAQWDGTDWVTQSANAAFGGAGSGPVGLVAAVASTSAGIVVGGLFGGVQNDSNDVLNTNRLAMWNGTSWVSIGTVVGNVVEELRVIGNYLYVGGAFSRVGGVAANNIARAQIPAAGGQWNWEALTHGCTNGVNDVVRSIVDTGIGDGSIYVAGRFTAAGGVQYADRIAKYSPGAPACPAPPASALEPLSNFRVAGFVRDRVEGRNGMRVHLTWDAPDGYISFSVTTAGFIRNGVFDPSVQHGDLSCQSTTPTCSIFFPFTSNVPAMEGRQYHQVVYTLIGEAFVGSSAPLRRGPLMENLQPAPAPTGVQAFIGHDQITVTWDPLPSDAEGLTAVLVTSEPTGRTCIVSLGFPRGESDRSCTFRNMRPGVNYRFRVQALSLLGWGPRSAPSNEVAAQTLRISSVERSGPQIFLLGGTRVTVVGDARGYPTNTRIRPFVKIGNGPWKSINSRLDPAVRPNRDGSFRFTHNVAPWHRGDAVQVRFEVGDSGVCAEERFPAISCGIAGPRTAP